MFSDKYLKYKQKYLKYKKTRSHGGSSGSDPEKPEITKIKEILEENRYSRELELFVSYSGRDLPNQIILLQQLVTAVSDRGIR